MWGILGIFIIVYLEIGLYIYIIVYLEEEKMFLKNKDNNFISNINYRNDWFGW